MTDWRLEFDPRTSHWFVALPRADHETMSDLMSTHGFDFSVTGSTPQRALLMTSEVYAAVTFWDRATPQAREQMAREHQAIEDSWATDSSARYRIPADKELWAFQKADLSYALQRQHTLVGDQPGLGKTQVAIVFANEIRAKRTLVVCPAAIRLQWAERIREWSTLPWPFTIHTVLHSRHGIHPNAEWTVLSYDLASNEGIGKAIEAYRYDLLILDELHYAKTVTARRTRAIFGGGENRSFDSIMSRAERVLGLTGTPLPNRPREIFTIARAFCYDSIDWLSEEKFTERFNPSVTGRTTQGKFWVDEKQGRLPELQNRLRANFMVRHEKHGPRGVMKQLKLPLYDLIRVDETGPVKAALAAEKLLDIDPDHLEGADFAVLGHIAAVRKQMGIAIAPQIADWVKMLLDGGEDKLVVFGHHHAVLDIWEEAFQKYGVVRIDGSTSSKQRFDRVLRFQANPSVKVIIGNLLAMGVGTDGLQHVCNHCLIGEPDWVTGNNQQAIDRLDRGGQRSQVQADIFVAQNSIAERILASALRKGKTIDAVLDKDHAR